MALLYGNKQYLHNHKPVPDLKNKRKEGKIDGVGGNILLFYWNCFQIVEMAKYCLILSHYLYHTRYIAYFNVVLFRVILFSFCKSTVMRKRKSKYCTVSHIPLIQLKLQWTDAQHVIIQVIWYLFEWDTFNKKSFVMQRLYRCYKECDLLKCNVCFFKPAEARYITKFRNPTRQCGIYH